jgi:hypothetical protein
LNGSLFPCHCLRDRTSQGNGSLIQANRQMVSLSWGPHFPGKGRCWIPRPEAVGQNANHINSKYGTVSAQIGRSNSTQGRFGELYPTQSPTLRGLYPLVVGRDCHPSREASDRSQGGQLLCRSSQGRSSRSPRTTAMGGIPYRGRVD